MIQINTRLSYNDYVKFNYRHFFSLPYVKLFLGIVLLNLGFFAYGIFLKNSNYEHIDNVPVNFNTLIFPGFFLLIIISIYFLSKRSFNNSKSLNEPIVYIFSEDKITVKGESFESENSWDKYVKVLETKGLFIFYQDKLIANLVPKVAFSNSEELNTLRELIASKSNLKSKLRKD